jgi:hypothetical protein
MRRAIVVAYKKYTDRKAGGVRSVDRTPLHARTVRAALTSALFLPTTPAGAGR